MNETGTGFTDEQLIFLVSQPRAGSTLLQSILAGADAIHTTAEPWIMLHPLYALRETGYTADYDATVGHRALQDFLNTLKSGATAYEGAVRLMALALYGQACAEADKPIFLDKTPRYYKILPELARLFPRARFIILLRNPAAVLSSIIRTWIGENWMRFDYFHDDLLSAPRLIAEFVANYTERVILVRYEALVTSPEKCVRMVCDQLGLAFNENLLRYGERTPPSGRYGDPSGIMKHDRPSTESVNGWLEHAKDPQVRHLLLSYINALGHDLIAELGYDSGELSRALTALPPYSGKPAISWDQLIKPDKSRAERLILILTEARRERSPGQALKQLGRLLTNRV